MFGNVATYAHTVYLVYPNPADNDTILNITGSYRLPDFAHGYNSDFIDRREDCGGGPDKQWYVNGDGTDKGMDRNSYITVTQDTTLKALFTPDIVRYGYNGGVNPGEGSMLTYGYMLKDVVSQLDIYTFGLDYLNFVFKLPETRPTVADSGVTSFKFTYKSTSVCWASLDTAAKLPIRPAPLTIKARPVILQRDSKGTLQIPPVPAKHYDVKKGLVNDDDAAAALKSTTGQDISSSITVRLLHDDEYYKQKVDEKNVGRLDKEVGISGSARSANYQISYEPAPVYISYISFDIPATVVYGDEPLMLNATHANNEYNGQLTYYSSKPDVIAVSKDATGQWVAQNKKVYPVTKTDTIEASIFVCFKGNGNYPADTVALPVSVLPYRGLRIRISADTLLQGHYSVADIAKNVTLKITGLQNGDSEESLFGGRNGLKFGTNAADNSPVGDYLVWTYGLVNRNYAGIKFDTTALYIRKMGTKRQSITFDSLPHTLANAGTILVFAEAKGQDGNNRKITYSCDNVNVAEVIRDTIVENGISRYGAKVRIKNTGTTNILAYQPGDTEYKDTSAMSTLTVDTADQQITFSSFKLPATEWWLLEATATSGLSVRYTSSDTAVAVISGDTAFVKGKVGSVVTITAHQNGNHNYYPAQSIALEDTVSIPDAALTKISFNRDGARLTPAFKKTKYDYTLTKPCGGFNMTLEYKETSKLTINDVAVTTKTFSIADYPTYDTLRLVVTNEFDMTQVYTIVLQKTVVQVVQFWEDVYAVNINSLSEKGYGIDTIDRFQWYSSVSSAGNKTRIAGITDAYLDIKRLSSVPGYLTVKLFTTAGDSIEGCPFQLPTTPKSAALLVYPNPVQNAITVVNTQWQEGNKIELFDLSGTLRRRFESVAHEQVIDITGFREGIYILRVGKQTARIVIR
ncbi:hypothetical protein FACS189452_04430 [Bacteroidia bacterium]|nr:hypothetical protein FACS189452_04430 [Bacteroidia bacterium]